MVGSDHRQGVEYTSHNRIMSRDASAHHFSLQDLFHESADLDANRILDIQRSGRLIASLSSNEGGDESEYDSHQAAKVRVLDRPDRCRQYE